MLPDGVASRPWRGRARPEANDGILAGARCLLDAGQAPADLPRAVVVRRPRSSGPRRLDRSLPGLFDAPGGLLARRLPLHVQRPRQQLSGIPVRRRSDVQDLVQRIGAARESSPVRAARRELRLVVPHSRPFASTALATAPERFGARTLHHLRGVLPVSYTHLRAHETPEHLV